MNLPEDIHYHPEHTWVRREGEGEAVIGVSDHAQSQLGEVSLVTVPPPGTRIALGEVFGTIESIKVASDLHAPATGEIIAVNGRLADEPWLVNDAPYGDGWIVRVRLADVNEPAGLESAASYLKLIS